MSYLRDTAFVLLAEPFRERDLWLTLYGEQHGKLVGIARGVRTSSSKQRGHIEPYSKIEVMVAKGSAYDKIAVAQTCASSHGLRASLAGLAIFGSAVALVARSTQPAVGNQAVFFLLNDLQTLLSGPEAERISAERSTLIFSSFALHFLEAEGYAMEFDACRVCGQPLGKEAVWLSTDQGGVICRSCVALRPPSPTMGDWISAAVLQTLRFLIREPFTSALILSAPRSVLLEAATAVDRMLSILPGKMDKSAQGFLLSLQNPVDAHPANR